MILIIILLVVREKKKFEFFQLFQREIKKFEFSLSDFEYRNYF